MAFIPSGKKGIKVGDRVRLVQDVEVGKGTFTKGHEFTVVSIGWRGPDLMDDDGNELIETGLHTHVMEKVGER